MASFRIYSTLFIIAALAICSTASLSLQNFIGAENHAATAKISTPQPTTTTESPRHQDSKWEQWEQMSDMGKAFFITLVGAASFAVLSTIFCMIDAYRSSSMDWGRKFYFAFRDNVCCGFCVRRMGRGKMYEYEEI